MLLPREAMRRTSSWRTCRQCRRSTDHPGEHSFDPKNICGVRSWKREKPFPQVLDYVGERVQGWPRQAGWYFQKSRICIFKSFSLQQESCIANFLLQVSSVCKFDSSTGNLSYCGTICLQVCLLSLKYCYYSLANNSAWPDERGGHLEADHRVLLHDPL